MKRVYAIVPAIFVLAAVALAQNAGGQAPGVAPAAPKVTPCSTEKVNGDCTLTIDRTNPLQPPTLQMYPGKVVTVKIENGLPFESLSLDWQSSSAILSPDPSSSILSALDPAFGKASLAVSSNISGAEAMLEAEAIYEALDGGNPGDKCSNFESLSTDASNKAATADTAKALSDADTSDRTLKSASSAAAAASKNASALLRQVSPAEVYKCVGQLMGVAKNSANHIAVLVNPDSVSPDYPVQKDHLGQKEDIESEEGFTKVRGEILCRVLGGDVKEFNGNPVSLGLDAQGADIGCPKDDQGNRLHDLVGAQEAIAAWVKVKGPGSDGDLSTVSTYTNTLVTSLTQIAVNLLQPGLDRKADLTVGVIQDPGRKTNPTTSPNSCNASLSKTLVNTAYARILQRQVSCGLNAINRVATSAAAVPTTQMKKTIVTITANYTDARIETSAGVLLSALPSRSFTATSTYSGTPPAVTSIVATESDTRPLIIPFAAVHVRLGNDWLWNHQRRGGLYATFLAGVNPNTTTADFGAGSSVSWRSLVISPVAHFAHDVRLTDGFTVGEQLGTSFKGNPPTQQFWTTSFGLGISFRTPLIPGR